MSSLSRKCSTIGLNFFILLLVSASLPSRVYGNQNKSRPNSHEETLQEVWPKTPPKDLVSLTRLFFRISSLMKKQWVEQQGRSFLDKTRQCSREFFIWARIKNILPNNITNEAQLNKIVDDPKLLYKNFAVRLWPMVRAACGDTANSAKNGTINIFKGFFNRIKSYVIDVKDSYREFKRLLKEELEEKQSDESRNIETTQKQESMETDIH